MNSGKFIINQGHVTGQCIGNNQQVTMSFGDDPEINVSQRNQSSFSSKPSTATQHLASADGVAVQCKLQNGDVVFVPLDEIFKIFEKKLAEDMRRKGSRV